MIKVALPNKGLLFEPALQLLNACGYRARKPYKTLTCLDPQNNIEFYFLRPSDIPMYVGEGIIELGITGLDLNEEKGGLAQPLLELDFGQSKLCAAVPNDSPWQDLAEIAPLRVATSFGGIARRYFKKPDMRIVDLEGAVEISVGLGVADAIIDVVETGTTLKQAGLRIIGEPLYRSTAALFVHPGQERLPEVTRMKRRIEGHLVAMQHVMVEYNAPKTILDQACRLTPGFESPTVIPLQDSNWYSIKAMLKKSDAALVMDQLSDLGCKAIVLNSLESARI